MTLTQKEMSILALQFCRYLTPSSEKNLDFSPEVRYMIVCGREDGVEMVVARHPEFGPAVLTGGVQGPVIVWLEKRQWSQSEIEKLYKVNEKGGQ